MHTPSPPESSPSPKPHTALKRSRSITAAASSPSQSQSPVLPSSLASPRKKRKRRRILPRPPDLDCGTTTTTTTTTPAATSTTSTTTPDTTDHLHHHNHNHHDLLLDDTVSALHLLRRMMLRSPLFTVARRTHGYNGLHPPPLVLKHMLYAMVQQQQQHAGRTAVERTVDLMLHGGHIRQIRMPVGAAGIIARTASTDGASGSSGSGALVRSRFYAAKGAGGGGGHAHTDAVGLVLLEDYIQCLEEVAQWYDSSRGGGGYSSGSGQCGHNGSSSSSSTSSSNVDDGSGGTSGPCVHGGHCRTNSISISIGSSDRYDEWYEMDRHIWEASAALQRRMLLLQRQRQQSAASRDSSGIRRPRLMSYVDSPCPSTTTTAAAAAAASGTNSGTTASLHSSNEMDSNVLRRILQNFKEKLIPQCREMSVSRDLAMQLLGATDRQMTQLIRFGLFTIRNEHSFWFSLPNLGPLLQSVQDGREEVIGALRRKKYKEMMLHQLLRGQHYLKKSKLSMEFHVKEVLGSGLCETVSTTNGDMIVLKV